MYEKLIRVLRHCGNPNVSCKGCADEEDCLGTEGAWEIGAMSNMRAAAEAIDGLDTLLDGVRADNDALCETIDMLKKQVFDMSSLIGDYSEKTRWIPVTERLPEDCTPVQVCYIGFYSKEIGSDMLACRYEGLWCYWDGEPCSYYPCNVEITHWQPLTEPPKEETV